MLVRDRNLRSCARMALAGVFSLLVSTPALAEPPSRRVLEAFKDRLVEVSRDDQRVVEGKLVAIDEESVVVVTDEGAEVTVPRERIASIRAAGAPPPAARKKSPAPVSSEPEPGLVHVHIESPESPVQLHTDEETAKEERVVCLSPCNQELDGRLGQRFVLKHRGVAFSPPLELQGRTGSVRVTVDRLPSRGRFVTGVVLLGVGGAAIPVGVGLSVTGNQARPVLGSRVDSQVNAGYGMIVGGGISMTIGIVLAVLGRGAYSVAESTGSSEWSFSPFAAPVLSASQAPGSPAAMTGATVGLVGQF